MLHLDRILFGTDGSECAEHARQHAFHLADRFDAALHVVHVEERDVELTDVIDIRECDILDDLHTVGESESGVAEPRVQEHCVVHPAAAEGILAYAAEHDMDLVVLGTHGRRGVRRLVLGSVAEEVIRRAPQPVFSVGRGTKTPDGAVGGQLLVPVDFSEFQDRLLAHARELALAYDMSITIVHAIDIEGLPGVYGLKTPSVDSNTLTERTRQSLEPYAEVLREAGIDVEIDVRHGPPAPQILEAAEDVDADLLAIATHGRTGFERLLLGSVAETVIRQAPCPVFTVKSFGTSLVPEKELEDVASVSTS